MTTSATKARYFKSAAEFSSWLESNHDSASEMLVGFYKKSASRRELDAAAMKALEADRAASAFRQRQPPGYRSWRRTG